MATTVDVRGLEDQVRRYGFEVASAATSALVARKVLDAPRGETGDLAASIEVKRAPTLEGDVVTATIGSDLDRARFLEEGTGPHRIDGDPLLVFHWPKAGGVVFLRHVNHPGSRKWVGWWSDRLEADWVDALQSVAR